MTKERRALAALILHVRAARLPDGHEAIAERFGALASAVEALGVGPWKDVTEDQIEQVAKGTDGALNLFVKGSEFDARRAAKERGIPVEFARGIGRNQTVLRTSGEYAEAAERWRDEYDSWLIDYAGGSD